MLFCYKTQAETFSDDYKPIFQYTSNLFLHLASHIFSIKQGHHAIRFLWVANQHTIDPKHTIPAPCQNVMDKGALSKNEDTTADNTGMK